jgi:uncharacterized protein (UPF0335 family)
MARGKKNAAPTAEKAVAEMQPDELNALRELVKEFMSKVENLDSEMEGLKQDKKELIEEYKEKLDMKTLQIALRILKLQNAVQRRDSFDFFMEALTDPAQ